jgi:hypothetical protein
VVQTLFRLSFSMESGSSLRLKTRSMFPPLKAPLRKSLRFQSLKRSFWRLSQTTRTKSILPTFQRSTTFSPRKTVLTSFFWQHKTEFFKAWIMVTGGNLCLKAGFKALPSFSSPILPKQIVFMRQRLAVFTHMIRARNTGPTFSKGWRGIEQKTLLF